MLTVSNDVKAKLKSDICRKELRIMVGSTVCTNSDIYNDSFELTESIMDSKVEFVGCISSILKATISTTKLPKANLQGQTVEAEVAVYLDDNTLSAYIPLFHGYVDSCETSADGHWQNLVCYDCLAYLTDTPIYNAYKKAFNGGSITLAAFRSAIFTAIGIGQEIQTLPNDAIKFRKRYRNKDLTALALIRHITQINGAFGIINRDEFFEYKYIDDSAAPEDIPYYRSLEYANTTITPINTGGLTIRTNSNDAGVTVDWSNYQQYAGTDPDWNDETQDDYLVDDDDEDISEGNYVIEANLIAYKLKKSKKQVIAANIMDAIGHDAVFRQYKVVCNGLPYIECGDKVRFTKADSSQIGFVVFKRTLKGVQAMTDTYECMPSQEVVTNVDTEGGGTGGITPQTVNNDASYVSNIAATTQSMGPDNALLGLIEKSVNANGTYSANDDGAEGYSEVKVNVPGGGGGDIGGMMVQATAIGDIAALSTVAVVIGQPQTATIVQSSIPSGADVGYGKGTIYYSVSTQNKAYTISESDLAGTPEEYKTADSGQVPQFQRNIMSYRENSKYYIEELFSKQSKEIISPDMTSQNINSVFMAKEYFKLMENNDRKLWKIKPLSQKMGSAYGASYPTTPYNAGYALVRSSGNTVKYLYSNTSTYTEKRIDSSGSYLFRTDDTALIDTYIMLVKSDGTICYSEYYEVGYDTLNLTTDTNQRVFMWNAEGTQCFANLGSNGLAVFHNDGIGFDVYANISSIDSNKCCMFSHYFWDGAQLWDLRPHMTMFESDSQGGGDMLGYVKDDVENNEVGTAFVLFS